MVEEQIVITLTKKGAEKAPDYYLKIYEDGTVIYEGNENVKIIGRIETSITKFEFLELLAEFRDLKFFNLMNDYSIVDDEKHPRTIISLSLPVETGEIRTKAVTFFQGDPTIPEELKKIENKIHEIVKFDKWDESLVEKKPIEEKEEIIKEIKPPVRKIEKPLEKPVKKKSMKLMVSVVAIIIIIAFSMVLFTVVLNYSDENQQSNGNNIPVDLTNESLNITKLVTASEVTGLGEYTELDLFDQNQTVYVYVEYDGFKTDESGNCDLVLEVLVREINGEKTYTNSINENNANKIEQHWRIDTDITWSKSAYFVVVSIKDNISSEFVSKIDAFTVR